MGLCIVVVLGAGLRAYALDFQSLWADEIPALMITDPTRPFRQFWDRVLADIAFIVATLLVLLLRNVAASPASASASH